LLWGEVRPTVLAALSAERHGRRILLLCFGHQSPSICTALWKTNRHPCTAVCVIDPCTAVCIAGIRRQEPQNRRFATPVRSKYSNVLKPLLMAPTRSERPWEDVTRQLDRVTLCYVRFGSLPWDSAFSPHPRLDSKSSTRKGNDGPPNLPQPMDLLGLGSLGLHPPAVTARSLAGREASGDSPERHA
jgi:hypothetical protein